MMFQQWVFLTGYHSGQQVLVNMGLVKFIKAEELGTGVATVLDFGKATLLVKEDLITIDQKVNG